MTQYTPDPSNYSQPYQPTPRQEERRASLQRFNRRYVYLPLGFMAVVALVLTILFLVGVFSPAFPGAAAYASALADITIILFVLPMILLMAAGPALLAWIIVASRQRREEGRPRFDDGGKLHTWLWQLDSLLEKVYQETAVITQKASKPLITVHVWMAYAKAFLRKIQTYLKRS